MKIKISEATEHQLDWLVESIEIARMRTTGEHIKEWWVEQKQSDPSPYTTDWLLAGPIIEREEISVEFNKAGFKELWTAYKLGTPYEDNPQGGPTPLIAAMRCLVASKLGDEVEVPDELA